MFTCTTNNDSTSFARLQNTASRQWWGACRFVVCTLLVWLTLLPLALNVVIKYAPGMLFPTRKNNFYVPPENAQLRRILGGGLEVWGGYFSSIRPAIGTMIMNFDRAAGAFKMSGASVEVLKLYLGRRDARDLELARMPPRFQVKTKRFLKNMTVALKFSRDPNAK